MSVAQGLTVVWIAGVIAFWGWIVYRILRATQTMRFILGEIRDYPFSTTIFLFVIVFTWPASIPLIYYMGRRKVKRWMSE